MRGIRHSLLALGVAGSGCAQEPSLPDLRTLMSVRIISAGKGEQDLAKAPAKVLVLTREELNLRGYTDLEEVLHDLPGFDVNRDMGAEWSTPFMRGLRGDNTDSFMLVWGGIVQNDVWKANVWLSKQYPLLGVERIEVLYGPSSLLYGTSAFSGIVNVILQKPGLPSLKARSWVGSDRTRALELAGGGAHGPWNWSLQGRFLSTDDPSLEDRSWIDTSGRVRRYHLTSADFAPPGSPGYDLRFDPQGRLLWVGRTGTLEPFTGTREPLGRSWFLGGQLSRGAFSLKGLAWGARMAEDYWYIPQRRAGVAWSPTGASGEASWQHDTGSRASARSYLQFRQSGLEEAYSWDGSFRFYSGPTVAGTPLDLKVYRLPTPQAPFETSALSNQEWRLGQQLNLEEEGMQAVAGWELLATRTYEDYNTRPAPGAPRRDSPQHEERDFAVFGQAQVEAGSGFALSGGLRYDYDWLAGERGGFGHLFTGRLAALLHPAAGHHVKVIYGQAFQAPSAWQKYSTNSGDRLANPSLQPTRLSGVELVHEWTPAPWWENRASLYYNQIRDLVRLQALPAPSTQLQNRNEGGIQVFGFEWESRYLVNRHHSYTFNGTLSRTRDAATGERIGDLPTAKANLLLDYLHRDTWGVGLRAHWVGFRPTINHLRPTPTNATAVPGYFTVDLALSRRALPRGLEVSLDLWNVLDRRYADPGPRTADGLRYNAIVAQPGRRWFLSLAWRR